MIAKFFTKSKLVSVLIGLAITGSVMSFQNCGSVNFETRDRATDTSDGSSPNDIQNCTDPNCTDIQNGVGSCTFDGQTIANGATVTSYLNSSVATGQTCQSEVRTCNNGVLTGSYTFASCTVGGPASCQFNGQTVLDGASVSAYLDSGTSGTCTNETRTCSNGVLSGSYQFASCSVTTSASCLFNGTTIASGSGIFAYQTSSVASGQTCSNEFRLCANGQLSGSFAFSSCSVNAPLSCVFNGQTVPSGSFVTGYQNSTVAYGQQCVAEARLCTNGVLAGSYNYASCVPAAPASCLFDGQTIPSGGAVTGYLASTVTASQSCQSQGRSCVNGVLSGTYAFSTCTKSAPASCQFNGQTVSSSDSRVAYQTSTVPYGQTCAQETRQCVDGNLSGSYTFGSCTVGAPAACQFNGRTVAHGEIVTAFQASTVAYGQQCASQSRTCSNGTLSGTYAYDSCQPAAAAPCTFNGQTLVSGSNITAYTSSSVAYGSSCISVQQTRTCTNGVLSGSATFANCQVQSPAACTFNGQSVASGSSVIGYAVASVPYGSSCAQETRTCTNGVLSGSASFASCQVQAAAPCSFNGQTVANGTSVTGYAAASVPYGSTCAPQTRTCSNGTLSGTYSFVSCAVQAPVACSFNGQTIASGSTVTGYAASSVAYGSTCSAQARSCTNGVLSGSYGFASCAVQAPVACSFNGQAIASGNSVTAYAASSVAYGSSCSAQTRSCTNGVLSGSYGAASCAVQPPAACSFNGQTIGSGGSVTAYAASSVPYGSSCSGQARVCSNGSLSGSYGYPSCTVAAQICYETTYVGNNSAHAVTTVVPCSVCQTQSHHCNNGAGPGG